MMKYLVDGGKEENKNKTEFGMASQWAVATDLKSVRS